MLRWNLFTSTLNYYQSTLLEEDGTQDLFIYQAQDTKQKHLDNIKQIYYQLGLNLTYK